MGTTASLATDLHSQTFVLQPGWNAIYLEVEPEPNDSDSVLGGLPIASAWTWNPRGSTVEFVQDPSEGLINVPGWLGFFPHSRPESFLTNMFSVQANRAYLLEVEGSQPYVWTVTGRPSMRPTVWVPDSFNLVGFHVDPGNPPTFAAFLAPSEAHAGQAVFRLNGSGVWEEVLSPAGTAIVSGEAYWVYCSGPSEYSGPLAIDLDLGDGMDFGASLPTQTLRIHNLSDAASPIILRQLSAPQPVELSLYTVDPDIAELSWPPLPTETSFAVEAGEEILLDLAVRPACGLARPGSPRSATPAPGISRPPPPAASSRSGSSSTSTTAAPCDCSKR